MNFFSIHLLERQFIGISSNVAYWALWIQPYAHQVLLCLFYKSSYVINLEPFNYEVVYYILPILEY